MDKATKFSLFDFCKKHSARVEVYGKETLDEEGEIIPFIEQAAIMTHYLQLSRRNIDLPYREKAEEILNLWYEFVKGGKHSIMMAAEPNVALQQSLQDFKRLGYPDDWINQRLKSIEIRKDLTDQWKTHNVEEGSGYAALTDIIYAAWSGLTARQYKENPRTMDEHAKVAARGVSVAKVARDALWLIFARLE